MKKIFSKVALVGSVLGFTSAMAVPVTVDVSEAQTSLLNAGTAMIGIAVAILGTVLVIKFLKRG